MPSAPLARAPRVGVGDRRCRLRLSRRSRPGCDVGDRAHAVPLDLERPVLLVARQRADGRAIIGERSARASAPGPDPPAGPSGGSSSRSRSRRCADREQPVAAAQPLAVERDLDLARPPICAARTCPGPRSSSCRRRTGPWGSRRGTRGTRAGGPRCDRQAVVRRVGRDAVGDRPRGEHAVVLEAQVPVQAGGVVLLDDEPVAPADVAPARRLGGGVEVALGAVGGRVCPSSWLLALIVMIAEDVPSWT